MHISVAPRDEARHAYFFGASRVRHVSRADLIEANMRWANLTANFRDTVGRDGSPSGTVRFRFTSSSARTFCAMSIKEILFAAIPQEFGIRHGGIVGSKRLLLGCHWFPSIPDISHYRKAATIRKPT